MKVRVTFVEPVLGTGCANPKIHAEYIASRSGDAAKLEEEIAALPADELLEKSITVFARTPDGRPMFFDYQVKGFLKEALGILVEFVLPETKVGKSKLSRWTYKRVVDNAVIVKPRSIPLTLPEGGEITHFTRPLRGETMKGERVSLVTSEEVPAGTTCEFEVTTLCGAPLDDLMRQCLDYGAIKGMAQWRNSGRGRFAWEELK
jgi:hypothetical protein